MSEAVTQRLRPVGCRIANREADSRHLQQCVGNSQSKCRVCGTAARPLLPVASRWTNSRYGIVTGHRWRLNDIWRARERLTGRSAANPLAISRSARKFPVHRQLQSPSTARYFPTLCGPAIVALPASSWFVGRSGWLWFGASYAFHRRLDQDQ